MYSIVYEKQFFKDFDYWKKIVPGLAQELKAIIEEITETGKIPDEYNPHLLTSHYLNYTGNMEFHLLDGKIGLLIIYYPYRKSGNFRFIRLGTHEELFHDQEK